jgi:hypothetical protein
MTGAARLMLLYLIVVPHSYPEYDKLLVSKVSDDFFPCKLCSNGDDVVEER